MIEKILRLAFNASCTLTFSFEMYNQITITLRDEDGKRVNSVLPWDHMQDERVSQCVEWSIEKLKKLDEPEVKEQPKYNVFGGYQLGDGIMTYSSSFPLILVKIVEINESLTVEEAKKYYSCRDDESVQGMLSNSRFARFIFQHAEDKNFYHVIPDHPINARMIKRKLENVH